MKKSRVTVCLLALTALLLSGCEYQLLPDDDPHGPHHTDIQHDQGPGARPNAADV